MTDDEFLALAHDYPDDMIDQITSEFTPSLTPAFTALLTRDIRGKHGVYTESMWLHGYPAIRSVVVTHPPVGLPPNFDLPGCDFKLPGCVRTIPVSPRAMASVEVFKGYCTQYLTEYLRQGWTQRSHTIQGS